MSLSYSSKQFPGKMHRSSKLMNKLSSSPHDETNTLHNALKPIICLAQCFGLFPILGIQSIEATGLYFRWCSKRMLYSVFIIAILVVMDILTVVKAIKTGLSYYNTVEFVFLATAIVVYSLFIQLAIKWPEFSSVWSNMEHQTKFYDYKRRMAIRFHLMTWIIMILALVEHASSIITKVVDAQECLEREHGSDLLRIYFINAYKPVFSLIQYHAIIAFPIAFLLFIISCAWNFMDLFIILLSIAMSERYKQLNLLLKSVEGKSMPISFWKRVREMYNELSHLTRKLDDLIAPIVLLSFANNLYFICLQLLHSLEPMKSVWHAIYFVYSFSYLVLRTAAVSLFAATIYEQSKEPKSVLFSVPSDNYCIEVSRMLLQVTSDELSLTGCKFFSVTRTLVLTVAGTIVTYEIVLVQFNAVNADDARKNVTLNCASMDF